MKYQVQSWTGRVLFDGKKFDSFEDGWDFIYVADPQPDVPGQEDNHYYDDYYVELCVDTIEFEPWDTIPEDLRRGTGDDREVFGVTFTGDRVWIRYMGRDD